MRDKRNMDFKVVKTIYTKWYDNGNCLSTQRNKSAISHHKFDFRQKMQDTKSNYRRNAHLHLSLLLSHTNINFSNLQHFSKF